MCIERNRIKWPLVSEENRVSCSGHLTPEIGSVTKQRHLLLSSGNVPYTYVVYLYIIHPGDYQSVLHRLDYICRNWRILWIINDGLRYTDMHFKPQNFYILLILMVIVFFFFCNSFTYTHFIVHIRLID